jgi:hypothetical protein
MGWFAMRVRDFKRYLVDLHKRATLAAADNKMCADKWRAEGRQRAYKNIIEWLELFDPNAELERME